MNITTTNNKFSATKEEIAQLLRFNGEPENKTKNKLWLVGIIIAPVILAGMLFGYGRAYNLFLKHRNQQPTLANLKPIARVSMVIFGIIFFLAYILFILILLAAWYSMKTSYDMPWLAFFFFLTLLKLALSTTVFKTYNSWQTGIQNMLIEKSKFGTAHFANDELKLYRQQKGIYIGGGYNFSDNGHILTTAGTRGGKGVNLIIPNLLGVGGYRGSCVVIDPKGENAFITARFQRAQGRKVIILNPWELFAEKLGKADCYNPLDLLADKSSIHLVDDVELIAEMIVPVTKDEKNSFFVDNARAIVAGLLLHLVTSEAAEKQTLKKLWQWVRLSGEAWNNLIGDMAVSDHVQYGETVQNSANQILKLTKAGENTFGSIMATVLQCTDFLKSPSLQKSLQSGFDPYNLADGNTTVYVIIPADKLKSHYRWLRLIITTTMRSVVRKPNKKVTFLLDEYAGLGFIPEIEVALSTYAGFNITVWIILQSLIQLKNLHGENWETFTANCSVRQFFNINDNFSADYVSSAIGMTSHVIYKKSWWRIEESESNQRPLITPDELRRESGKSIFAFIGSHPVTYFPKLPYYQMPNLIKDGVKQYDDNPYFKE